jgi:H+/Cl- antiporter ClcA
VDWLVAPIKLLAAVLTLAFGGSVGKEGPCVQTGGLEKGIRRTRARARPR